MSLNNIQLAASVFQQNDLRIISVNEAHPQYAHVYYRKDNNMRVMLVPKNKVRGKTEYQLQQEVEILINRSPSEQQKIGKYDGNK